MAKRGLTMIGFPGVSSFRDRHGKARFRLRRKGLPTVYLPNLPGSPEFAQAYAEALAGEPKRQIGAERTTPGTLNALAVVYLKSAEWKQLRPTTRATYGGIIERLRNDYGALPLRGFTRERLLAMRDKRAATPAAANNMIKVLRILFAFAVDRNLRADNPAEKVKPLRYDSEGNHVWTEEEIAWFEARWPVGTRERLAMDLLLYTAQRSGDVRTMGRQHLRDGRISVVQEKTRERLEISVHSSLAASLATVPAGQLTLVVTQFGEPYTAGGFGNWFAEACDRAGLPHCSAHGLRHSAATRLAEGGCTEAEIMAVTGHRTSKQVQRYTRTRDQKRLADSALAKIGGTQPEQDLATSPVRLAKTGAKCQT